MRVLIDQSGYELLNSGDLAMLMSCADGIHACVPDAELSVLTRSPQRLAAAVPGSRAVAIGAEPRWLGVGRTVAAVRFAHKVMAPAVFPRVRRRRPGVVRAIQDADVVVSSGGGFLNDSFVHHALGVLSVLRAAQRAGKRTAMFGQGLGPITNPLLRRLAAQTLPNLDVLGLREGTLGPSVAAELGVPSARVLVTGDDALRLAGAGGPPAAGGALGVNLRLARYAATGAADAQIVAAALGRVYPAVVEELVALPVSSYASESDLQAIASVLPPAAAPRTPLDELPQPADLAREVSRCRAVLTGSYHVAVFALARGIPVVGVSNSGYYDHKFNGLAQLFPETAVRCVALRGPAAIEELAGAVIDALAAPNPLREAIAESAAQQCARHDALMRQFFSGHATPVEV